MGEDVQQQLKPSDDGPMPLWARVRIAWWIVTDPRMTEQRIARTVADYYDQQEADRGA